MISDATENFSACIDIALVTMYSRQNLIGEKKEREKSTLVL